MIQKSTKKTRGLLQPVGPKTAKGHNLISKIYFSRYHESYLVYPYPMKRIGLALGSGAAKGLAHIGVIRALEEMGFRPHAISGTSIGAIVGLLYAYGLSSSEMMDVAVGFGKKRLFTLINPAFFRDKGLANARKIEGLFKEIVSASSFEELATPFSVVATEIMSGKRRVFSRGELHTAVRASYSIPTIFPPVRIDGGWFVDGALTEPVPVRALREMGCTHVIAVNVSCGKERTAPREEPPGPIETALQTIYIFQRSLAEASLKEADVALSPDTSEFGWLEFESAGELSQVGYEAAMKEKKRIERLFLSPLRKIFK